MFPVYRTLSGEGNPSYITTTLQQSGVDTAVFFGEAQEYYATEIQNNTSNDIVISNNNEVAVVDATTAYNYLSVNGTVTNFGITIGPAVISCTNYFDSNFNSSYISAYSITNAIWSINPVYGTGYTNITANSQVYTLFFDNSSTSPNTSIFNFIRDNVGTISITAASDIGYSRSLVNDIILSGNKLIFCGMFQNNVTNIYNSEFYQYPADNSNYTNIAYFDTTSNRLKKLANIGTFSWPLLSSVSANSTAFDRVYTLALCGNNLVAGGKFSMVNTTITGFQNLFATVSSTSLTTLCSYGPPFNADINVGDILTVGQYKQLITNPPTIQFNEYFFPTYSGDPCQNIAYYSNSLEKWLPFTNTRELPGRVRSIAVRNNTVYTTGRSYSGSILYHDGSDWQFLSNSYTMSSYANNLLNLSGSYEPLLSSLAFKMEGMHLNYSQYNDRLLLCGIFSGYDVDYRKSGVMAYDFNNNSFVSLGSGINIPASYMSVVCGENVVVVGDFQNADPLNHLTQPSLIVYLPPGPNQVFRDLCDFDKLALASIYCCTLCGTNVLLGGYYQKLDSFNNQEYSFVTYVDKNFNLNFYNVQPSGPFSNTNPFKSNTDELTSYAPNVLKVFDYIKLNYTVNSNISADFVSESIYNNEPLIGVNGIGVFGNSTYLGISGINVDF